MNQNTQLNILTFDIEEWYHFDTFQEEHKWLDHPPRIELYLPRILDKLDQHETTATFFCLGWIARHYPEIIKLIKQRGHEIACHSYKHLFVREMTPESFDKDLKLALDCIQNVTGEKITSFRAPAFSICEDSVWAFEVLSENGIENDCSIFSGTRSFGGFPSFEKATPTMIKYKDYMIREFPMSMGNIFGKQIAFNGGGYFRLFPYSFIKRQMKKLDYNMAYLHMRDFDYEQPRFKHLSNMRYFKSYYGIKDAYQKFERMFADFKWMSLNEAIEIVRIQDIGQIELT